MIQAGAFAKSLARGDDVACVIEHDWGRVVARRSGGTLDLTEDATGLKVRATLAKTTKSADLVADIEHGNIKGMSFRFYPSTTARSVLTGRRPTTRVSSARCVSVKHNHRGGHLRRVALRGPRIPRPRLGWVVMAARPTASDRRHASPAERHA